MKLITTIVSLFMCTMLSFAQQSLDLKIKQGANKPNSEKEHLYLLEISNSSRSTTNFTILTTNISCIDISKDKQTILNNKTLNKTSRREFDSSSIGPNSNFEFYIKLSRLKNTSIGKWNCTEIKAIDNNGNSISNSVVIKSLIPDPKNQH
jgi:hypothetical protein